LNIINRFKNFCLRPDIDLPNFGGILISRKIIQQEYHPLPINAHDIEIDDIFALSAHPSEFAVI
jgi:hypothetical protein